LIFIFSPLLYLIFILSPHLYLIYLLTAGLDTNELTLCPTDQHLVRLAGLVSYGQFYDLVIHLGLPDLSWKNIVEQYQGYDLEVVNFFALCKWRQQKYKEEKMTSFKDLSVALTAINHQRHVLCQVGNN
jgi:hypothetical protein